MFLSKLELQGFKTFARKTVLSFPGPAKNRHRVTSIVGPNGSGKSNLADAIRWALGEQSLKLLRGKKSEDVIFSGSEGRTRAGFAEVILTFNNEDGAMPVDFSEVVITRRLYRDGESDYLLNGARTRRSDIQLLLAQCNVGQNSYSVVGQGMVDHVLVATPEERKSFFDDATGVKQFQLKRHESLLTLKRTYENLAEVELLLREVEPRLRSLKRQVSRLEKREEVEAELKAIEKSYYGTLWWQLEDQLSEVRGRFERLDREAGAAQDEINRFDRKVAEMERGEGTGASQDAGLVALQASYREAQKKRAALRDEEFETQKRIELKKVEAQSNWSPLPLSQIIGELEMMTHEYDGLVKRVKAVKELEELKDLEELIANGHRRSKTLLSRLQKPAPEDIKPDPKLVSRVAELKAERAIVEDELERLDHEIETYAQKQERQRTELFVLQREMREKQRQVNLLENQRNDAQIELARFEERQTNLSREMDEAMKQDAVPVKNVRVEAVPDPQALYPEIQRLHYKLELIGGIDPEIMKEFEETNERFEFLSGQVEDLRQAMKSTEGIIDELDEKIRDQSEKAFKDINREFQRYFKILFGGGSCSLVKMTVKEIEEETKETDVALDRSMAETGEAERAEEEKETLEEVHLRMKEREDRVVGIDIQATPPGKRLKNLNLLSGGERALTSIALLSAIMAVNPSPFVVLDEVDAALDEANTLRFASILEELSKLTQYIVVTHNRATMEKADILYGVTMGDDGVSNLLSVNLEDIEETGTARR